MAAEETSRIYNILIVDDIEENLSSLERQLRKPGRRFIRASSGIEAMEKLENEEVCLIIMDIKMPNMNGFETARQIKLKDNLSDIPILFITAVYLTDDFIMHGYGVGAVDYITKPVEPYLLKSKVDVFLRLHQQKRDLEEKEKKYRTLFEQSNDAVIIHNGKGQILDVNRRAEELLGYNRDQLCRMDLSMIKPDWARGMVKSDLEQVIDNGHVRLETVFIRENGAIIDAEISSSLIEIENKVIQCIARDITDRKRVEKALLRAKEEAEAASRVKSQFLSNMNHEIRTPVNGIMGMLSLLSDSDLNEEQKEYLDLAQISARTLLKLINDILDFSRMESGQVVPENGRMSLSRVVQSSLSQLMSQAGNKGLTLSLHLDPDVPDFLLGDPGIIRQILLNLVENAIKFTERGQVQFQVEVNERNDNNLLLHFTVTDTGIGVPEGKIDDIFSAFTQADGSITRKHSGAGLGLSICSELVKMMGGRIWADSEEGKGSTFHFTARFGMERQHDQEEKQSNKNPGKGDGHENSNR